MTHNNLLNLRQIFSRLKFYPRDLENLVFYGLGAPYRGQRIYINPIEVRHYISCFSRKDTGKVIDGDWDSSRLALQTLPKIAIVHKKLQKNMSWEEAGAYENMLYLIDKQGSADGCTNIEQIQKRYAELDKFIAHLKRGGKYLNVSEMGGFREFGGVYIHIDRDGEPIFGGGGFHRLAIAQALELLEIPAQLGVIHSDAIRRKKFKNYRFPTSLTKSTC